MPPSRAHLDQLERLNGEGGGPQDRVAHVERRAAGVDLLVEVVAPTEDRRMLVGGYAAGMEGAGGQHPPVPLVGYPLRAAARSSRADAQLPAPITPPAVRQAVGRDAA